MKSLVIAGAIAILLTGCATLSDHGDTGAPRLAAAEIRRLEERLTTAFNDQDTRFVDQVIAPEYVLLSSGRTPGANLTRREDWMRVWLGSKRFPYEAKILDVVVAGDTAVATLEARWTRDSYLTDTWARRNGRWQLVFRHSVPRS